MLELEAEPATASFTGVAPADESREMVSAALPERFCCRTRLARCHPLTALFRTAQTACVQGRSLDHTKRQIPGAFC